MEGEAKSNVRRRNRLLASKARRVEDYLGTGAGSSTGGDSSTSSRDFGKCTPLLVTDAGLAN